MADDKELTTEEKAALIGKKVDTEHTEEVPDYEITEDDGSSAKDEADDDRLGKTRETAEHKHLSNREKRQLRKKRLAEKFDAKDNLIRQQQDQLNAMAVRLNDVDGKLSQVDQDALLRAWNETQAHLQAAEREYTDAFSSGDGVKATAAMGRMYEAKKRSDELQAINARNQSIQAQPRQVQRADPVIVSKAQEWAGENSWFKQGGADDDSAIADAIALKLVKEGYDPKSDDYWDELDDRLSQKGIGSSDNDQQDQSQSQRERQEVDARPARRRSPPVSGGSGRGDLGGKVKITLPTEYIKTLKDNGYWDDPKVRNRMIARYQDGIRQREAEGKR